MEKIISERTTMRNWPFTRSVNVGYRLRMLALFGGGVPGFPNLGQSYCDSHTFYCLNTPSQVMASQPKLWRPFSDGQLMKPLGPKGILGRKQKDGNALAN